MQTSKEKAHELQKDQACGLTKHKDSNGNMKSGSLQIDASVMTAVAFEPNSAGTIKKQKKMIDQASASSIERGRELVTDNKITDEDICSQQEKNTMYVELCKQRY